ncbi:hypothetical protein WX45_01786 [Clostridium ljungdahlii DSM 13528]|uniref:DUF6883 domain-containing protein n=1 Tax=Clostridium ljungdahlii (strain ATCC 55383 / DSM 13528 / PETC) TaxID=748727 RepID=D8GQ93_CLOLD|nr:DUF6883 domain-containing protein [Clostridium ljungdahlii]ADK16184.1 conserved hypothetical protein [Clostridium ljungdahlii DSM 13528]OAA89947.1 hypothetical protein WX45_01786 [Clostridium ljungdahlii DSM 13528]
MNEYQSLIKEARENRDKLTRNQFKQIRDLYKEAAKDLKIKANKARKGSLTERWLKDYSKAVRSKVKEMNKMLKSIIEENMKSSAEYATAIQLDFFGQINMRYGLGMSKTFTSMFSQVPSDVVEEVVKGNIYKDGRGLSKRIWWTGNKVNGDIDKIIQKGIVEKKSAIELAQDLQAYVNPDAQKDLDWKKVYPGTSKTIDYSAQRLARTSISHAYTLSLLKSCERNPFITKVRWHSVFAPGRTCSLCKDRDGREYLLKDCPMDHPNGLCYQEPLVDDSLENIGSRLRNWVDGNDDSLLDEWYEKYGDYFNKKSNYINIKNNRDNGTNDKYDDKIDLEELLPNIDNAIVPEPKIKDYALNMNHPTGKDKAIAFDKALGYNQENADDLIRNIKENIENYKAIYKDETQYGKRYEVIMNLEGPNGKTANVLTAWIIKNGDDFPSLTSVYVTKKKVK